MSDSFNVPEAIKNSDAFDASQHLEVLCSGGKVELLNFSQIAYQKGWAAIIEDFVKTIKRYPIEIDIPLHIRTPQ